ncbi:tRNA glutamyl-Q(34) synthetase GluQRS [Pseudoponticoccus marisrubri]|uniref:Glutamyl-Q tRNA(Asp) synthetase n=1 Tax=Pseudoponticoccus marisrubri TaxID=1685382 RepID=A0A0W7WMI8_9RHOB|nr:tRNA glutamyl-Q(34) synthetase GluQRS [Pseudoponticoccus marisrubri]KUF11751.1 glutamyl-Q tRNA(Asp) synthetase [Pseudoponticoccus marisrubri]
MTFTTRFAPSPTGPLHLGHAFSALLGFDLAQAEGGTFLLRIDDLDQSRARPEWEAQIKDDLTWLGLSWPEPCRKQSECHAEYEAALDRLWQMGLLYPCRCTRRDIREALSAPQEGAPIEGPDGLVYPGTCRAERAAWVGRGRPTNRTLRLDMAGALERIGVTDTRPLRFETFMQDLNDAPQNPEKSREEILSGIGDVVLARRDAGAAYHLAVVVDDAAQAVTHVIRGADLHDATFIHTILQDLLGLSRPRYLHHRLIRDAAGKRLAKRDDARAIATYRDQGLSPQELRAMIGL